MSGADKPEKGRYPTQPVGQPGVSGGGGGTETHEALLRIARHDGQGARFDDEPQDSNPYLPTSPLHAAWARGWTETDVVLTRVGLPLRRPRMPLAWALLLAFLLACLAVGAFRLGLHGGLY